MTHNLLDDKENPLQSNPILHTDGQVEKGSNLDGDLN